MFKNLNIFSSAILSVLMVASIAQGQVKASGEYKASDTKKNLNAAPASSASTGLDSSKQADMNEAEAGGLEAVRKQFEANFKELTGLRGAFIEDPQYNAEKAAYDEYIGSWDTCVKGQKYAAYACLSNLSPKIQDAVAGINSIAALATGTAVNESCSTFGKAMGVAQAALTAYTAACGAAKGHCGWYCSNSRDAVEKMKTAVNSSTPTCRTPTSPNCPDQLSRYRDLQNTLKNLIGKEMETTNIQSIAGKTEVCTSKYPQLLLSAATGIYGVVNALKQGKNCEDDSSADGSTAGTTTAETCAIEANANLPECICLKNPMLEGCGAVTAKSSMSASGGGLSALSANEGSSGTDGLTAADLATGSTPETLANRNPSSSSSGGVGAPTGGGGASLGGGSGFGGGSAAGEGKDGHKALDTNILGGASGGGGGGGMWGGGDSSSDKSGYRSYLPGGAKDPTKLSGQQQNWNKEVTGQGGKSNFEKVRDRYQDNKRTLINN